MGKGWLDASDSIGWFFRAQKKRRAHIGKGDFRAERESR